MKKFAILGLLALLGACDRNRSGAEEAVRMALKDPDSAKFGELYFNEETNKGCLGVNAKNSMGGYTGEQLAYMKKTESGWEQLGIVELPLSMCRAVFADVKS